MIDPRFILTLAVGLLLLLSGINSGQASPGDETAKASETDPAPRDTHA
jgi:hypothetical protein